MKTTLLRRSALLIAVLCCAAAAAQDAGDPQTPRERVGSRLRDGQRPGEDMQPDALRTMLTAQLEASRQRQSDIEGALKLLDEGRPIEDVMEAARLRRSDYSRGPEGAPPQGDRPEPTEGDREPRQSRRDDVTREQLEAFVRESMPPFWEKYTQMRGNDERFAQRIWDRLEPRVRELYHTHKRDETLGGLKIREFTIGIDLMGGVRTVLEKRADAPESEEFKAAVTSLRGLFADYFDVRAQITQHEIDRLGRQIERMRAELDDTRAKRAALIEQRLNDVLNGNFRPFEFEGGPPRGERERR